MVFEEILNQLGQIRKGTNTMDEWLKMEISHKETQKHFGLFNWKVCHSSAGMISTKEDMTSMNQPCSLHQEFYPHKFDSHSLLCLAQDSKVWYCATSTVGSVLVVQGPWPVSLLVTNNLADSIPYIVPIYRHILYCTRSKYLRWVNPVQQELYAGSAGILFSGWLCSVKMEIQVEFKWMILYGI
jgi:hypothetical protein